jgi:hypothetical protein
MYVVVHHHLTQPDVAYVRGQRLMTGEGAPAGVRVVQFLPGREDPIVTCLWESPSLAGVQGFVDVVLGDSSRNYCYEVNPDAAFAERPLGMAAEPALNT